MAAVSMVMAEVPDSFIVHFHFDSWASSHIWYSYVKISSSVASPICQEGQSERIFPIFAFFFLIFPLFSDSLFFPISPPPSPFPDFWQFFRCRGGTLPPLHPQWLRHWKYPDIKKNIFLVHDLLKIQDKFYTKKWYVEFRRVKRGNGVSFWPLWFLNATAAAAILTAMKGKLLYLWIVSTKTAQLPLSYILLCDNINVWVCDVSLCKKGITCRKNVFLQCYSWLIVSLSHSCHLRVFSLAHALLCCVCSFFAFVFPFCPHPDVISDWATWSVLSCFVGFLNFPAYCKLGCRF